MKNYIGYLPYENIENIPRQHVPTHEFLFYLHDQCLNLLIEYEQSQIDEIGIDKIVEAYSEKFPDNDSDIIEILEFYRHEGLDAPYYHFLISKILIGLTSDLLHFTYEALKAFEKRKFSVAYSLLRKPFKENLVFICQLFNNYENFLELFEQETDKSLNNTSQSKRISIFQETISKLSFSELFDANLIEEMISSKQNPFSLEISCQKATHLITSQGKYLKTGRMSINSIFDDPNDVDQYEPAYTALPTIMIFTTHVILEAFQKLVPLNKNTYQHITISTLGCYENLYIDGRKRLFTRNYSKACKDFLQCIHCGEQIFLTKENSLRMFMTGTLICNHCHQNSEFPFYWLLSKSTATFKKDESEDNSSWKDTILYRIFKSEKDENI